MGSKHENRISIIIVDDHEVVRNGIRSYIDTVKDFQVVAEAASGEAALKLVSDLIPDIVLLDLIMPGMDGVETTRRIKQISPRTQEQAGVVSRRRDIFPALESGRDLVHLERHEDGTRKRHRAAQKEVTLHPSWRREFCKTSAVRTAMSNRSSPNSPNANSMYCV
ncbi:MAG: response regulator [Anaerolineales bacterium]